MAATPNAFQQQNAGGADAFVVKIDPRQFGAASLIYATYVGGSDSDNANSITVDSQGVAVITGSTKSNYAITPPGFPVTANALQSDLAIQSVGDTHCHGTTDIDFCSDVFVTALSPDGSALLYSTYLGGSGPDVGLAITLDPSGRILVSGQACGFFPITADATQQTAGSRASGFLAALDPGQTGTAQLAFSTFLGGSAGDAGQGIATDGQGNVYVGGWTNSQDFPLVNPIMTVGGGNAPSVFVSKFVMAHTLARTR
jgi:hypothetical protein